MVSNSKAAPMPQTCMRMNDEKSPSLAPHPHPSPAPLAGEGRGGGSLYRLLAWLTPAFPVGAFSFSHALEAAVESGAVDRRGALKKWIAAVVRHGSGRIDADILRDAHRAATAGDL